MTEPDEMRTRLRYLASRPLTENELAWIDFLRLLSNDGDPAPTLARVQALRHILAPGAPPWIPQ